MIELTINNKKHQVDVEADTPLLWVLRDTLNLTGTKYGCGIQQCGACTVLIKGRPVRSCGVTNRRSCVGRKSQRSKGFPKITVYPVQQAWIAEEVPQCGYCQSGQILSAVSLLKRKPNPSDQDIDRGMLNLCRCGTYVRVRKAIHRAAEMTKEAS